MTRVLRFPFPRHDVATVLLLSLRPFSKGAKDTSDKIREILGDLKDTISLESTQEKMRKSIDHFKTELGKIHTGRATPGMLDHLHVSTAAGLVPLSSLATVTVKDVHRLGVSVFDASSTGSVFSAIESSPLQLTPKVIGDQELSVMLPRRSKESIEGLIKHISKEAEHCKTTIRAARKLGMSEVKSCPSKDDRKRGEKAVGALTDCHIKEVDEAFNLKKQNLQD